MVRRGARGPCPSGARARADSPRRSSSPWRLPHLSHGSCVSPGLPQHTACRRTPPPRAPCAAAPWALRGATRRRRGQTPPHPAALPRPCRRPRARPARVQGRCGEQLAKRAGSPVQAQCTGARCRLSGRAQHPAPPTPAHQHIEVALQRRHSHVDTRHGQPAAAVPTLLLAVETQHVRRVRCALHHVGALPQHGGGGKGGGGGHGGAAGPGVLLRVVQLHGTAGRDGAGQEATEHMRGGRGAAGMGCTPAQQWHQATHRSGRQPSSRPPASMRPVAQPRRGR